MKIVLSLFVMFAVAASAQTTPVSTNATTTARPAAAIKKPAVTTPIEPTRVQVMAILGNFGFVKCATDHGDIMISGLPPGVGTSLAGLKQFDTQIESLKAQLEVETKRSNDAADRVPKIRVGDKNYIEAGTARRVQADQLSTQAKNTKEKIKALEAKRAELYERTEQATTILAYLTAQRYASLPVWRFAAMAPKIEKPKPVAVVGSPAGN